MVLIVLFLCSVQSTKAVYNRVLDLKIANPQIIINYAVFLEEHRYFEESFKVWWSGGIDDGLGGGIGDGCNGGTGDGWDDDLGGGIGNGWGGVGWWYW